MLTGLSLLGLVVGVSRYAVGQRLHDAAYDALAAAWSNWGYMGLALLPAMLGPSVLATIVTAGVADLLVLVSVAIYSDGEIRREAWQTGFAAAVDGYVDDARTIVWHDLHGNLIEEASYSKVVGAKLRQIKRITALESGFLKIHSPGPFKITMPSPLVVAQQSFKAGVTDKAYASIDAMLRDVMPIITAETYNAISHRSRNFFEHSSRCSPAETLRRARSVKPSSGPRHSPENTTLQASA